jgi:hypothetical protein
MSEKLKEAHIRALKAISFHEKRFQPLELRSAARSEVAELLLGLAERGECDPRFQEWGYPTGYRLTRAGRNALAVRRRARFAEWGNVPYWHFSEMLDRRARVCLSGKFGRTRERVRLPPLT